METKAQRPVTFTAAGKPCLTWDGARFVLARIRAPRRCARCGRDEDARSTVYLGPRGRALCEPCGAGCRARQRGETVDWPHGLSLP